MPTDPYSVLGVPRSASKDEVKRAYRSLAQKHHPDKFTDPTEKANAEVKFKEISEAYELIESGKADRPSAAGNGAWSFTGNASELDEILRAFHHAHHRQFTPTVNIGLTLKQAYQGCTVPLNLNGRSIAYNVRPGFPQGVAYEDQIPDGDKIQRVIVRINIRAEPFEFRHLGSPNGMFYSGDLELPFSVNALDMLVGSWVVVKDFLDQSLEVRIPSAFEYRTQRLKVAGKGYSHWMGDGPGARGDLYLRLVPHFPAVTNLDPKKVEELYNATRPTS